MNPPVPTTRTPNDPSCFYMRILYRTFFFGPFKDRAELVAGIKALDAYDPMWDYDPACIIRGANPLPKDFVFGFPFVEDAPAIWAEARAS